MILSEHVAVVADGEGLLEPMDKIAALQRHRQHHQHRYYKEHREPHAARQYEQVRRKTRAHG